MTPPIRLINSAGKINANSRMYAEQIAAQFRWCVGGVMTPPYIRCRFYLGTLCHFPNYTEKLPKSKLYLFAKIREN